MQLFATGDRAWRARPRGPAELREMAHRFNDMADELARQRAAQLAFLAGIAHDLRNPLMPLRIATTLLADPTRTEGRADVVQIVSRQVDHLERMIGDLLETSRVEAGHVDLRLENVDAGSLAAEVLAPFRSAAPTHVFELTMPERPVIVHCDPLRVMQVLNNLVSNAVKYSPEGGLVRISLRSEAGDALLSVEDEGIGISTDEQARLFEPFRRSGRAKASAIPGVGLGLFVARRIVEAHNGRLDVHSRPGAGSTFFVRLPLTHDTPGETSSSLVSSARA
jgi:two-component system, OmpR family, sensor histidine kinase MtrB